LASLAFLRRARQLLLGVGEACTNEPQAPHEAGGRVLGLGDRGTVVEDAEGELGVALEQPALAVGVRANPRVHLGDLRGDACGLGAQTRGGRVDLPFLLTSLRIAS
jgi:hypothetical protein